MISLLWVSFGLCVTSIIELIRSLSSCGSGVGISFVRKFDVDVETIRFGLCWRGGLCRVVCVRPACC